jgi:hypothetical protein
MKLPEENMEEMFWALSWTMSFGYKPKHRGNVTTKNDTLKYRKGNAFG